MDQALDIDLVERDENAEGRDRGIVPSNTSPMRSFMKKVFSQASTSRVASSASRSVAEQCRPMSSQLFSGVYLPPASTALIARCTSRSG